MKVLEALGFKVSLLERPPMLRTSGVQPGKSRRSRDASAHTISICFADAIPTRRSCFSSPPAIRCSSKITAELKLPDTEAIAQRCFLFEQFVDDLLSREPDALQFNDERRRQVAIHAHCHAKSLRQARLHGHARARVCPVET